MKAMKIAGEFFTYFMSGMSSVQLDISKDKERSPNSSSRWLFQKKGETLKI